MIILRTEEKEYLYEKYEDALFALLMDQVAIAQGKWAIEEKKRLDEDPSARIPAEVDRRCMHTLSKYVVIHKFSGMKKYARRIFNYVTAATFVIVLLFSATFAAVPQFLFRVLNMLIQMTDINTSFRFSAENTAVDDNSVPSVDVGWLPEHLVQTSEEISEFEIVRTYSSLNTGEETLILFVTYGTLESSTINIDSEDMDFEEISISGNKAILVQNGEEIHLAWLDGKSMCFVELYSSNLTKEEIVKIGVELNIE